MAPAAPPIAARVPNTQSFVPGARKGGSGLTPGAGGAPLRLLRLPRGTPIGRRAGLVGIGLLFAGFNTGNNLFYLIFTVMAASELVGFFIAGRSLRALSVAVSAPRRGRAGSPLRVSVTVENQSRWFPAPALRWMLRTEAGDETTVVTPALAPGAAGQGTGRLVPSRRGLLRLERAETHTSFPLGLARRTARLAGLGLATLVTPRLERTPSPSTGHRRGDIRQLFHPKGLGEEPFDAREYRPGDDARWIDWKASARTERLMWRDRRGDPPRALRVALDRSGPEGPGFEARVSRAAGAAVAALAAGRSVGLVSDEMELLPRSGPAQRRRILDYLAIVAPRGASLAVQEREIGSAAGGRRRASG